MSNACVVINVYALPCFLNHSFLWNSDSFCSFLKTARQEQFQFKLFVI